jgi:hypothetical protein
MSHQQLKLRNLTFPIAEATITATLVDPHWAAKYAPDGDHRLFWSLDVQAAPLKVQREMWEPRIYHETMHFDIRSWKKLEGQSLQWSKSFDERSGEPNGGFYVFEHGDITRADLRIGARSSTGFVVDWTGRCNVHFDGGEFGADVPFELNATAVFRQIVVNASEKDDDASVRARLAQYLELADLIQQPLELLRHRYEDGVRIAHGVFNPGSAS